MKSFVIKVVEFTGDVFIAVYTKVSRWANSKSRKK